MPTDDELDRMLRESDPAHDGPMTDPDSPTAVGVLARVRRRTRQRRKRILVLAPAVALAVAGATAGTYAWVGGDGKGHTFDSTTLSCRPNSQRDNVVNFDPRTDDPVRTCRREWRSFGVPAPSALIACVDSSSQGAIIVFPGGRDECERHRADPYVGPTQEQLRFAQFRADIKAHFAGRTCVPYPEFKNAVAQLLSANSLTNWKTSHLQTVEKEPEGACAEISSYDEPNRTVDLVDHGAGDPMIAWP